MLRLAPSHPPLWRSPSSIQLGAECAARVDDVSVWQERLLDALVDGIPDAMLAPLAASFGAAPADAAAFVRRIGGALGREPEAAPRVRVEVPEGLGHAETAILLAGLQGAGLDVAACTAWPVDGGTRIPVIAVASRLLDPHRAARLVAADTPHLPVELSGDRVTVGPLVIPGVTACLACLHAHRRESDPTWPLVAVQLLARGLVPTEPALLLEAAVLAARLLAGGVPAGAAATVSAGSVRRRWHAHRPHAACLCRSPGGTATADAPDARSSAPTTARAYARPA